MDYNELYASGGFKYDEKWGISFIENETNIPKIASGLTLLDYNCGDGFWSKILSKYCKSITGIDTSEKGIEIAKQKLPEGNFICIDGLEYKEKHDIVFCRAAALFNHPLDSDEFKKNIEYAVKLANKYFIFIEWSRADLFNTYDGRWYYKNPDDICNVLKKYGETINLTKGNPVNSIYINIETKIK